MANAEIRKTMVMLKVGKTNDGRQKMKQAHYNLVYVDGVTYVAPRGFDTASNMSTNGGAMPAPAGAMVDSLSQDPTTGIMYVNPAHAGGLHNKYGFLYEDYHLEYVR